MANGSPIGDSPPILMALDAQVELRRGPALRRMPLTDFYLDYMKNALQEGEFVQAVAVPLAAFARQVRGYKISKRFDCDISALCAGLAIELAGGAVQSIRLAYGGMAGIVKRAAHAEALRARRSGLRANDFTATPLACAIGRVDGLEGAPLPAEARPVAAAPTAGPKL